MWQIYGFLFFLNPYLHFFYRRQFQDPTGAVVSATIFLAVFSLDELAPFYVLSESSRLIKRRGGKCAPLNGKTVARAVYEGARIPHHITPSIFYFMFAHRFFAGCSTRARKVTAPLAESVSRHGRLTAVPS